MRSESRKSVPFWLRVWLDFMILFSLFGVVSTFLDYNHMLDADKRFVIYSFYLLLSDLTVITCCIGILHWKKWAVYAFFVIHIVHAVVAPVFFLSFKEAPIDRMLIMSAESIGFIFGTLLITWLLLRPAWSGFK